MKGGTPALHPIIFNCKVTRASKQIVHLIRRFDAEVSWQEADGRLIPIYAKGHLDCRQIISSNKSSR